jgi:5'-3' exonuclease
MLLKGMRLGLDVSVFIVQLVKSPLYHDACLANSVGGMVKKVSGVVNQFVRTLRGLLDMGCSPFLVFDGHLASKPKDGERKRREERRNNALRALRDHAAGTKLLTPEDLKRNERASFKPGNELMDAVHFAALEMGINCVRAPMQADQQLVYFEATGVIDAIASVDSDVCLRGRKVLRRMDVFGNCGELYVENSGSPGSDPLSTLYHTLGIHDVQAFPARVELRVALGVMGGSDYYRVPGVAVGRALELLPLAVKAVGAAQPPRPLTFDNILAAAVPIMASKGYIPGTRQSTDAVLLGLRVAAHWFGCEPVHLHL